MGTRPYGTASVASRSVVLVVVCLALLSACSGSTGATSTATTPPALGTATTVSVEMQLLYQAKSADQWRAITASSAPIVLSGERLASGGPWGDGSGPGAQAQKKVQEEFIDLGVGLSQLLESLGC